MATQPAHAAPTPTPTPAPVPTPPTSPVPPVLPVPPIRRRPPARRFSAALFWAVVGALALLFVFNLAGYGPAVVKHEKVRVVLPPQLSAAQPPAQPASRSVTPNKPQVTTPAPQPVVPPPMPKPVVTPPAPRPETIINVYPPTPAPASPLPVQAPAPTPKKNVQPTGASLQLNIFTNSWGGGSRHGYGSTYGWTPGHVARVCEQRSTGTICFDRWIPHPHPGY